MNFFKLYIGDYQRDTAHLSVTEHGAYMLMLQHYYATEKPLPTGKALHRMLRAQDKAERDAIDAVVAQFWTVTDDGLINGRADEEITKAGKQADTNARIAQEREAKRKALREQHEQSTNRDGVETDDSEEKVGISREKQLKKSRKTSDGYASPRNSESTQVIDSHTDGYHESCSWRATNDQPSHSHSQTPDLKPSPQQAASTPQPETREPPTAAALPDAVTDRALQLVLLLRPRGAALQAGDPRVRTWAERGITDAQALQALEIAQQRRQDAADPKPINAGYLDAILADVVTAPPGRSPPSGNRPMTREDSRRIAATTRLSDFREACAAEQRGQTDDDSRTIEADASRLLG
ncbi:YdaU family protein [Methyloversatilis discipulorum]|uniref:YdaU family protein n=1 Tax=Methyloversatilis discipulorum TaxID=1119528 RepID=UPI00035EE357|nr:DUF1376 domain-containing protein [Methyloversatilis discipulorum]